MSEIHNSQGPDFSGNTSQGHDSQKGEKLEGISFKGEKTDLRDDPEASIKRTWVKKNKTINTKIGNQTVKFGSKEIEAVKKDLNHFYENPIAVQRAVAGILTHPP